MVRFYYLDIETKDYCMAKKKSITAADAAKLRDIDTYTHDDKKRKNIPPVGMAIRDNTPESVKTYKYDPHIDPALQWAGKEEGNEIRVQTSSIHVHESIKPHKIIKSVQTIGDDTVPDQIDLFESPIDRMKRRSEAIEFYKHGVNWTNRMIAGDSKVIMNSLLEKEGMAGQVQMFYFDPPYGIKYGSNFQPFVNKRDVKDKSDEDLSQEPEMIKAFRDTWELGIHSYLTYLRDRLLLAKDLLHESGSVFVQISDENVHHVREICDEIFGPENFVSQVFLKKTTGAGAPADLVTPAAVGDYIVWYAKSISNIKYHRLFSMKNVAYDPKYRNLVLQDGSKMSISEYNEKYHTEVLLNRLPQGVRAYRLDNLTSQSGGENARFPVNFQGKEFRITKGSWKTNVDGMNRLIEKNRVMQEGNSLAYVRFFDDFPYVAINNLWEDIGGIQSRADPKVYCVQTATEVIKRCMLMTTDPGDLVLDITCGSGTTAYVAEQWGRRWVTCDTSRVALALAKKRLMTATFDYYKLAHSEQGVASGFVYKTVPHITLKSIAQNEIPESETLYDQPEIEKNKIRITGPFTVEALPAPVVKPIDELAVVEEDHTAKFSNWMEQLKVTGILGRNGNRIEFSSVEAAQGTTFIQAYAETKGDAPMKAVVAFCPETKVMDGRLVYNAIDEAMSMMPRPKLVICAAFQFGPNVGNIIESVKDPDMTILKVQMNTDLMTEDLKKNKSSDQSFWLVGQPDVELIHDKRTKDRYKVKVNGFDYYDVKSGEIKSGKATNIAMWMLDTDYDGMCVEPKQVFFPMDGKAEGWNKLAKTLKAEIDPELIEAYQGTESLEFKVQPNSQIAVKIIDDRGIESLKVFKVGE